MWIVWLVSLRSPIITETHTNRSNRLLSSSLSLCVWSHVSHFCLSSPLFPISLSHLHICMFLSSALVLLSLSLFSFWISFLCFLSPSSLSSPLIFASDVTWPLFSVELQGRKFCGLHCGFLCLSDSRLRVTEGLPGSTGSELRLGSMAFDSSIAVSTDKRYSSACLGLCLVLTLRQRHRFKGNSFLHVCVLSDLFHGWRVVHVFPLLLNYNRPLQIALHSRALSNTCTENRLLSQPGNDSHLSVSLIPLLT